VVSSSLHNICGFKGDNSTVGVCNQWGKWESIRKTSIAVTSIRISSISSISSSKEDLGISLALLASSFSNSSKVLSSSLHNSCGFQWDNGTVGVSNQRGEWKTIRKTGIPVSSIRISSVSSSKEDLRISLTLLAASFSNSSKVLSSSLHNSCRFQWDNGTVGVSNQRGEWETIRKTGIPITSIWIRSVSSSKEDLGISLTLLAAIDSIRISRNSSWVDISSSFQWEPRSMSSLGLEMGGGSKSYIGVEGSNSAVGVGNKAIGTKSLGVS